MMKYINKEYGFKFRPPFSEFSEVKDSGPDESVILFPDSNEVGFGYDYSAINGAMLIGKHGSLWGIKISYFNGKKWLDNDDFIQSMGQGCASTPDGSFAHFSSGPLSVRWVRHNEHSLIAQVSARRKLRVRIVYYPVYGWHGELSIEGKFVNGRSPYVGIIPGTIEYGENNAIYKERYRVLFDDSPEREFFVAQSYTEPSGSANGAFNEAIMEFVINKNQPCIHLYACVGTEEILDCEVPRLDKLIAQIDTYELRYGVDKTMGSGVLGSPCESMRNSVNWSRIYYPYLLTYIYSPKRSILNTHFNIDGLDENCSALLGCLSGDNSASIRQLKYTLEDKVFSVLSMWHIFGHTNDKVSMFPLFQKLIKLYKPEPKLVKTTTETKFEVAYGWTDSPLRESKDLQAMYSLDLSCLTLLAFDVLERASLLFGTKDHEQYRESKIAMIELINQTFWNEEEGMYINRYVDGRWATPNNYGATSFYTLLCGAVDCPKKLSLLINNLLSPKKFWGSFAVTTLSASSPSYGKRGNADNNGNIKPPFLEFRGSIVPYVNYIIYHGLVRYGLDEIASKLAYSSSKLWANNRSDNVENYSLYLPKGKRVKQREYLSTIGNMLAVIGQQELIDIEYFRPDLILDSIRFGTFAEGEHSVLNLPLLNNAYSIEVGNLSTTVLKNNQEFFRADGGKFVVRNFCIIDNGCEFMIDAHSSITINLNIPDMASKKIIKYFFIVPLGKTKIYANNGMVSMQEIN
ncbi:MAG: hypothetical protein LBU60_02845 [Clostridiales bacterium]|jgi:hypothetical protein|nr:hypothetical protein [Clostridiales bacterium]